MKKKFRVTKNYQFTSIINYKCFCTNACFSIYSKKNGLDYDRVGISVSKKLGNAVKRNKIKRQVRSMIDQYLDFNSGIDWIIIVRLSYLNYTYHENNNNLINCLEKFKKRVKYEK